MELGLKFFTKQLTRLCTAGDLCASPHIQSLWVDYADIMCEQICQRSQNIYSHYTKPNVLGVLIGGPSAYCSPHVCMSASPIEGSSTDSIVLSV